MKRVVARIKSKNKTTTKDVVVVMVCFSDAGSIPAISTIFFCYAQYNKTFNNGFYLRFSGIRIHEKYVLSIESLCVVKSETSYELLFIPIVRYF